jgi:hypothetical protein
MYTITCYISTVLTSNIIVSCLLNHFIVDNLNIPEDGVSQQIRWIILLLLFLVNFVQKP